MKIFPKIAVVGGVVFLAAAIFYLSWIANPRMGALSWMPEFLGRWADRYVCLRTAIPFLALGAMLGLVLALRRSPFFSWAGVLVALTALVVLAELGQFFIPSRVADLWDVFWGMAGSGLGLGTVAGIAWISRKRKAKRSQLGAECAFSAPSSDAPMKPLHFLGLRFWGDSTEALLTTMDEAGGLLVVPSAPSLAQMADDPLLRTAHETADWAVVDGGYVALVLRALGKKARRISGLQLLEKTIDNSGEGVVPMKERRLLWVVPSEEEEERIQGYLEGKGFDAAQQVFYRAPFYQDDEDFDDQVLQEEVRDQDPDWVILCLGGGRQEKLGYFLRQSHPGGGSRINGPAIIGTGAAIAFFTGGQAKIPVWADRLYLGWLFRIVEQPKTFLPRYFKAFWHFPLMLFKERHSLF